MDSNSRQKNSHPQNSFICTHLAYLSLQYRALWQPFAERVGTFLSQGKIDKGHTLLLPTDIVSVEVILSFLGCVHAPGITPENEAAPESLLFMYQKSRPGHKKRPT